MGYRPDPMFSALVASARHCGPQAFRGAGWLTNYPTAECWRVGKQVEYFEGAKQRAKELGYELAEFWLREEGVSRRRLKQITTSRNILGVVVAAPPEPRTKIDFD